MNYISEKLHNELSATTCSFHGYQDPIRRSTMHSGSTKWPAITFILSGITEEEIIKAHVVSGNDSINETISRPSIMSCLIPTARIRLYIRDARLDQPLWSHCRSLANGKGRSRGNRALGRPTLLRKTSAVHWLWRHRETSTRYPAHKRPFRSPTDTNAATISMGWNSLQCGRRT